MKIYTLEFILTFLFHGIVMKAKRQKMKQLAICYERKTYNIKTVEQLLGALFSIHHILYKHFHENKVKKEQSTRYILLSLLKASFLQYSNIFIARRICEVLLVHCSLFIRIKTTFLRPTINWNYILIEYFSVGKLKELKIKRFKENFFKVSNKDVRNTFCVS